MRLAEISIDLINQKDCPRPDKWFLKSIKSDGVKIPVVLEKVDFGRYDIRDGRRRVFGAEHAALTTVPALVCEKEEFQENDRDYLTLLTKLHSSHNPVAELKAVQNLIQKGNLSLKEIAENLHVPLDRLKRIYKLANLSDPALDLLHSGRLTEDQALQLVRLPKEKQVVLIEKGGDDGITSEDIEGAIRENNLAAAQPFISGLAPMLPLPNPLVIKFEEVSSMLMASRNVSSDILDAINLIRAFIKEKTEVVVTPEPVIVQQNLPEMEKAA